MAGKSKKTKDKLDKHRVVSHDKWVAARKAHLKKEKAFSRTRDELARDRRKLPWERVAKTYMFAGPKGKVTLAELFGDKSQLAVYHFMFSPEQDAGCPHCSFWADHYDAMRCHLPARDVSFVVISRAPVKKLEAFKKRMGWKFPWLSSGASEFNYDFDVSFDKEEFDKGRATYNYEKLDGYFADREGLSVFFKDKKGAIYHTYSCFARGIDLLNGTYNLLDLVPRGRDEESEPYNQYWVRYHDEYDGRRG